MIPFAKLQDKRFSIISGYAQIIFNQAILTDRIAKIFITGSLSPVAMLIGTSYAI